MTAQPQKLSAIMKEMSEQLFRNPVGVPSSEAAHIALMFANIAWNETVGLAHARESYRSAWEMIEADNPEMWSEFKSNDVDAMIAEIVEFKKQYHPDDQRRILTCGVADGKVRVEWLDAAAAGVDSRREMELYGLVSTGERKKTFQFLRETRDMSRNDAAQEVMVVATKLGIVWRHADRPIQKGVTDG